MDLYLILLLSFTTLFLKSFSSPNPKYDYCSKLLQCGPIQNIGYPFYDESTRPDYCGYPGFKLNCNRDYPQITISGNDHYVKSIHNYTINVYRDDDVRDACPNRLVNTTLDYSKFNFSSSDQNITCFYNCNPDHYTKLSSTIALKENCSIEGSVSTAYYYLTPKMVNDYKSLNLFEICHSNLFIPALGSIVNAIDTTPIWDTLYSAFQAGYELSLIANADGCASCMTSGGVCGHDPDSDSYKFVCHCANGDYDIKCGVDYPQMRVNYPDSGHSGTKIIIGVSIGAAVLIALLGGCLILARKKRNQLIAQQKTRGIFPTPDSSSNGGPNVPTPGSNGLTSSQAYTSTPTTYSQSMASYASSTSDFGRQKTNYFGVHVFDYAVLEHITCNFHESKELGDGGFGTVYYGVLPDGRQVAVKRLYENSLKRVEQFMNEIQILASIQHKNLVALYGCTSRSSRELLLVYEYIPNGTVADHLHGKFAETTFLKWPTRLSIAVETAEALAFLHRRDVIHRDVKTANVLLDNDFHVKVADFGLSRLFPTDMTHVSTAPQGTPGYVDPEYYQCYRLTEKSDVYSFGVVLSELISSKHAVDITRHRHDVNLANMAVDRIQNKALEDLVDPRLGFDKDHDVQAMVKMVAELAFRCLQQDRDMRPTMAEVVASLRAIQLEGIKEQKQEVLDIVVYGDDVGLLTNPTPPLSPELPSTNGVV